MFFSKIPRKVWMAQMQSEDPHLSWEESNFPLSCEIERMQMVSTEQSPDRFNFLSPGPKSTCERPARIWSSLQLPHPNMSQVYPLLLRWNLLSRLNQNIHQHTISNNIKHDITSYHKYFFKLARKKNIAMFTVSG